MPLDKAQGTTAEGVIALQSRRANQSDKLSGLNGQFGECETNFPVSNSDVFIKTSEFKKSGPGDFT